MDEFGLIARFVSCFDVDPSPSGPGDDCAVLPAQGRSCVTTDALVEDVHFTRKTFSFEDIGHKALAVNLSDLAAMAARPTWFTVALGLPEDVTAEQVTRMGKGMAKLARVHGAKLIGGNVTRSAQLSLTLTVSGALERAPLLRSGAKVDDVLFVSGPLGDAAAGLRRRAPRALVLAQRRPAPHLAFAAAAQPFVHAAIDVSDGLAQDLTHVCTASGVGAELFAERIPVSGALLRFAPGDALELALRGGEDYVLLVAAPARHREALLELGALEVGVVSATPGVRLDGQRLEGRLGYQHR